MCIKSRLEHLSNKACYIFIGISAFVFSLCASINPFRIGCMNVDSAVFNYVARTILKGGMPYRDTFDHKGPLLYLINVLGALINENIGIWILELINIFIILYFSFKIAKLLGCDNLKALIVTIIGVFSLAGCFAGGNLVEEYACTFIIISLYIFIKFFEQSTITRLQLFFCGICFGAVILLQANLIALWGVMCIGVLVKCITEKNAKQLIKYIIWFLIGFITIILPILIWLIFGNALHAFLQDYLIFNIVYSSAIEKTPMNVLKSLNFFYMLGPVLISIPILVFAIVKERKPIDILCLISLILSVFLSSISGRQSNHYGMIFCPITIYSVSKFFVLQNERKDKVNKAIYISALSLMILVFSYNFLDFFIPIGETIFNIKSDYFIESYKAADIIAKNTEKTDKISVCGNQNLIYLLSDRESSSKYSYQYPIIEYDTKIKNEYLSDIAKLETEIIVIANFDTTRELLDDILKEHYKLIDTAGTLYIYKKLPELA